MATPASLSTTLSLLGTDIPCELQKHPQASSYVMRVNNGTAFITVPLARTFEDGLKFATQHQDWLLKQVRRKNTGWRIGTEFLFRGDIVTIEQADPNTIKFQQELIKLTGSVPDLRPVIEDRLRQIAQREFPLRVKSLGFQHGIQCGKVIVKDQQSRWGSSSSNGTISLNWRLVQTPLFVLNYVILHELAHQREMNHSSKFWQVVATICPDYLKAEAWLRNHASLLH